MAASDPYLRKVRAICLELPETRETLTWGKPHFRVGEKIFAGYGEEDGVPVLGFKLEMKHAAAVVREPRFWRAPYVGHKGWVSLDLTQVTDWEEVKIWVHESFQLIAPRRTLARMLAEAAPRHKAAGGRVAGKKTAGKKTAGGRAGPSRSKAPGPRSRKSSSPRRK